MKVKYSACSMRGIGDEGLLPDWMLFIALNII
jgi:hypothetical protein